MSRPNPPLYELPETPLDRAVAAVHDEDLPRETVDAAAERVWARLAAEIDTGAGADLADPNRRPIETCEDYQALLPAYLAGELTEARALLVGEHSRHCVPCRKALTTFRASAHTAAHTGTPTEAAAVPTPRRTAERPRLSGTTRRYLALAAVLALAVVTGGLLLLTGAVSFGPPPVMAEIADLEGTLLRPGDEAAAVTVGTALREGERVRTAKGSGAVLTLGDGTRIEMSERAELWLDRGFRGTTIRMDGGRIIVEAAKQRDGRLYVSTGDCTVSVVGTVFSVNSGLKGSRVSVLEGEVRVARGGTTDVLRPGDQITTSTALAPVPLAREISWSRDPERYEALLEELAELRRELAQRVTRPELRYTSELLPRVPAETIAYVAAPNLSETLDEAYRLLQEQLETSPRMHEIWQETVVEPGFEPHLEAMITQLRDLGSYLGDEVVVAVPVALEDEYGEESLGDYEPDQGPVLMAQVVRVGFEDYLAGEIERLNAEVGHLVLQLWTGAPGTEPTSGLQVWTDGSFLLASPSVRTLTAAIETTLAGTSDFVGTPFHQRLQDAYRDGVEWLFAADVATVVAHHEDTPPEDARRVGVDNLQHFLVERRSLGENTETGARLVFDGPRHGVFSWLAEPGPMRSLDFVSPEAPLMLGLVTKDPADMLADLFEIATGAGAAGAAMPPELGELQEQLGVDLREDLVAALGGEMAFALDGPLLQGIPWKLVLEVYDPTTVQATLEQLAHNPELHSEEVQVEITSESVGGHTFHTLRIDGHEIHYTFTDGFLVAAPSRLLVERALDLKESGTGLVVSKDFRSMLPADGEANFSALFYQDTRRLTEVLGEVGLEQLPPTLAFAYGHEDAVEAALVTPGDPLGLDWLFQMLFRLGAHSQIESAPAAASVAEGPVS